MNSYFTRIILLFLLTSSCRDEKSVTIRKDYVINPNWDEIDNSFQVVRMVPKDSSSRINLQNVTEAEIVGKLEEDTSFSYIANVEYNGVKYSERKVYFDKYNSFVWRKTPDIDPDRNLEYESIGELQEGNWYLLAGLSPYRTLYYVYIDSLDNLHCFQVMASNW